MFRDTNAVHELLRTEFGACRVLVVGDVMLDQYLDGDVSRISPEAPVPVVRLTRRRACAGGAANVAANLSGLGCRVTLIGTVGEDAAGQDLARLLGAIGVDCRLVAAPGVPTTLKTRVVSGHQQLLRIDEEAVRALAPPVLDQILRIASDAVAGADAMIVSDYAKGVVQDGVARQVIAAARSRGIPVLVDPKNADWQRYAGATAITPNTAELVALTGLAPEDFEGLAAAGRRLQQQLDLSFLLFTRGEHGMALIDGDRVDTVPAVAREVFDVSGAGDTVIATLTAGLASGLCPGDAMRLANIAAGLVVGKAGTAPVALHELSAELARLHRRAPASKVCSLEIALQRVARWKSAGERIVFTNGCFDVLHAGHVRLLEEARWRGEHLIVGVNDDDSVTRLKGPARPINGVDDRCAVLAALAAVDLVVTFAQDTPAALITAIHPDVLVKGGDYAGMDVVGSQDVRNWGGEVVLIDLLAGRSTSATLGKARARAAVAPRCRELPGSRCAAPQAEGQPAPGGAACQGL